MKKVWLWGVLGLMVVGIFLMNLYSIPAHDELSYAFAGQHTPTTGECPRVASLWDIVVQQYGDYQVANGRVFVHGLAAFFAGFKLYMLFDLLNTGMWFLFVWLVLREGYVKVRSVKTYLLGAAVVWWFLWYAETCSINAAFALNYLWMATATLGMMMLWRNLTHWALVPIAFFYGWGQESFTLPMLAGLLGGSILRSLFERRWVVSAKQLVAWLLMLAGACFLCFGPGALMRASKMTAGTSFPELFNSFLTVHKGLFLTLSPAVLAFLLVGVVWCNRRSLLSPLKRSPEWWCLLFASYGMFLMCMMEARLLMATLLAAVILVLREREVFTFKAWVKPAFMSILLVWILGCVLIQIRCGNANLEMLRLYREDPQGITIRRSAEIAPFALAATMGEYNPWHRMFFQREFEKDCPPIILSPWLYETLYQAPQRFFDEAYELANSGLYVSEYSRKSVVKRGDTPLTLQQIDLLKSYYANYESKPTGWIRFIPGRLRNLFPPEDAHVEAPRDSISFVAKDGNTYTLILPAERRNSPPTWAMD